MNQVRSLHKGLWKLWEVKIFCCSNFQICVNELKIEIFNFIVSSWQTVTGIYSNVIFNDNKKLKYEHYMSVLVYFIYVRF